MSTVVATLPKVELYCRLTDAMDLFQAGELAKEAGLPEGDDEAALKKRIEFKSPDELLAASAWQRDLVKTPQHLEQLAWRTTKRMLSDAVVHAELAIDICALPFSAKAAIAAIDDGVEDALEESDDAFFSWSLVGELHRGCDGAAASKALAAWHKAGGNRLCAISIVGDERTPIGDLRDVVGEARKLGLALAVQAGLTARPRNLDDVISLRADRVLHGIGLTRNEEALLHLRAHRVPVMVAPELEAKIGRARSLAQHPIVRMQDAGLFVTVASVSPGLLDSDLTGQLEALSKHLGWRLDRLRNLSLRSVEAAFMAPTARFVVARAVENWQHRPKLTATEDPGYGL
ncbi:MAG: hypothetical protein KC502_19125 [Myxococcales bacterium]|nr:hypothetical protein [Myxococcales bacterium]